MPKESQMQVDFKSLKVIRIQLILLLNIILKLEHLKQVGFDFFVFRLRVFILLWKYHLVRK